MKTKKFFSFGLGHINPELIDPDDYHQDRPSFKASQIYGNSPKDYYPLGKPPPSKQPTPDILGKVRLLISVYEMNHISSIINFLN